MSVNKLRQTKASPVQISGTVFRSYQTGINRFAWYTDDGRLCVARNYQRTTYYAMVDGRRIGSLFRKKESAMAAAVKAQR